MLLDLTHMRGARDHLERSYAPGDFDTRDDDFTIAAPVQLSFDIHKDGDQYRLAGTARGVLELACGRCLEPFPRPIEASFDLLYLPHAENRGEGEVEIEEDDLTTAYYRDDTIDLGQLLREQFYLALPMKPLCRPDCRGLCPNCGINLNREVCACDTKWEDPRLAPLRKLLDGRGDT
jgi:uncharacterized protein